MAARACSIASARRSATLRKSLLQPLYPNVNLYQRHVPPTLSHSYSYSYSFAHTPKLRGHFLRNRNRFIQRRCLCQGHDRQNGSVVETPDGVVHFRETRRVPYSLHLAFAVCSDVARYEEFVPWCKESKIVSKHGDGSFLAELSVGFFVVTERYLSMVRVVHHEEIVAIAQSSSLFETLITKWKFRQDPNNSGTCHLDLEVSFKFQSSWYTSLAQQFIETVTSKMVDAFSARCKSLEDLEALPPVTSVEKRSGDALEGITVKELESLSHFSQVEIFRVKDRFDEALQAQGTGARQLNQESFKRLFTELFSMDKPSEEHRKTLEDIAEKQFEALDLNGDGEIDLREFVAGMSIILKGTKLEKCRLWFRCYDLDKDGYMTREELEQLIHGTFAVKLALVNALYSYRNKQDEPFYTSRKMEDEMTQAVVKECFGDETKLSLDTVEKRLLSQKHSLFSWE